MDPKELLDKTLAEIEDAKEKAEAMLAVAEAEKDEFVSNVKDFVDTHVDPIADEVTGFMSKHGKRVVLGFIVAGAVVCAVVLLNDILPKYLF
jgi:hypothetical protein